MTGPSAEHTGAIAEQARPTALEESILAQPAAISAAITSNMDTIRAASALVAAARRVRLCGVGASGHAALVGEHMLRSIGIDARASNAFDLAVYPTGFDPGDLLIAFTHRGGANHTTRALRRASQSGLKTIAISGRDADLAGVDVTIGTIDQERSSTHTVSFTSAIAVLASIAARCEPRSTFAATVPTLPESVRSMLPSRDVAREVAQVVIEPGRRTLVLGSGILHPIARGGALSTKEAAYVVIEGNHLEDAIHGGLHAMNPGDVLIQLAAEGPANERNADLARISDTLELERWTIGGPENGARWYSALPDVPEVATPILATIPLQWLALECALALGTNPDGFRRDDPRFALAFPEAM